MSIHIYNNEERGKVISYITNQSAALVDAIELKRELIIEELLRYESFETAEDEIELSLNCLKNIHKELKWLGCGRVNLICTLFPVNLPLYSLIVFGIVPGFMGDEVIIRFPPLMKNENVLQKITDLLNLQNLMPHIKFNDIERSLFTEAFISVADIVIFTGRYENAQIVQKNCPKALFIYEGTGINPIIITESAGMDLALEKTIKTRIFNSGQDCAGPDIIFMHEEISDVFKDKLCARLEKIRVGNYQDRGVRVGPLIKTDNLPIIKDFFDQHSKKIIFGGKIDFQNGIVYPTVISEDITELDSFNTIEFFAPVFYLITYHTENDLKKYFSQKTYSDSAMYASIFGRISSNLKIPASVILQDKIINDIEVGNEPYGGYGLKANYVSYNSIYEHKPHVISQEISKYLQYKHSTDF